MDPSASAVLVWNLAAREAAAARFREIDPPHLFNALLTFSELDTGQFQRLLDSRDIGPFVCDRDAVRKKLASISIDVPTKSTPLRRRLRAALGDGGHALERGSVIHRSGAARATCEEAERVAAEARESEWGCVHLIDALLANPSQAMSAALAEFGVSPPQKARAETPLITNNGRDLTALAAGGGDDALKDPVSKVLVDELLNKNARNVLLVKAGARSGEAVMASIARLFISDNAPPKAKGKRIVAIDAVPSSDRPGASARGKDDVCLMIQEAAGSPDIILCLNNIHSFVGGLAPDGIASFKSMLQRGAVQCVATTDTQNYDRHFRKDADWRRIFRTITVHDVSMPDML